MAVPVHERRSLGQGIAEFMHQETSGAMVLLAATVVALLLANSPLHEQVAEFWHISAGLTLGSYTFEQSLLHWIDDGLMALFFFVVGLEIKREVIVGELSSVRGAALPAVAAIGGMIVPALVFLALNAGTSAASGWGVPMATDIAFALGILALLGDRVPVSLKVFLTALAIVDDIGAIIVIALFYTESVSAGWLLVAMAPLALMLLMNRAGVDSPGPYLAAAIVLWFCVLNSGIHATIAGVIAAFMIPARSRIAPLEFTAFARRKLAEIEECDVPGEHVLADDRQQLCALEVRNAAVHSAAPLQRLEFALHPFTTFIVLPLFALANAGIRFVGIDVGDAMGGVAAGIFLGLVVGKPLGVFGASWLASRLGLCVLPEGVRWSHVLGVGIVAGMGFTMSIFVGNLAFTDDAMLTEAKLAILVASAFAGLAGFLFLRRALPREDAAR